MGMNVGQAVSELRRMTVTELRRKYAEVFGEQTRSYHKDFLVRRIAWRMQANEEGGLPERARRIRGRALEIANDADLRRFYLLQTARPSTQSLSPSHRITESPSHCQAHDWAPART